jgi:hypothetical protein
VGVAPTTSSVPGTCSDSLSYKGLHRCLAGTADHHHPPGLRPGALSYGGLVRALGLEPSLVRGKGPVPYQSGVTRMVVRGPGRNRTSVVNRLLVYSERGLHGATDPCAIGVATDRSVAMPL